MGLISVEHLAARLDDPDLIICDVRWYLSDPRRGRREYQSGHLPLSLFVDLETVLTGPSGPGRHPLPSPRAFAQRIGNMGIGPYHTVVLYDSSGGVTAARMWWMLRAIGHTSALVLDGGFPAWVESGLPVTTAVPSYPATTHHAPPTWPGVVDRTYIMSRLGDLNLIDARASERYRGEAEPIDSQAGHIPTASNHPYTDNLGWKGRFLPLAEIVQQFTKLNRERTTVAYCGSGVSACQVIFSMELAGHSGVLLYEGSWSDWSAAPDSPIATGDESG